MKITKLPPGTALGAGDLHAWASNRRAGRSGVMGQRDKDLYDWARDRAGAKRQHRATHKAAKVEQRLATQNKKRHRVIIPGAGDPCPRCGNPMQIREHDCITERHLQQPFYYSRWFCCMNPDCQTTLVMPERFKVEAPVVWGDTWPDDDAEGNKND